MDSAFSIRTSLISTMLVMVLIGVVTLPVFVGAFNWMLMFQVIVMVGCLTVEGLLYWIMFFQIGRYRYDYSSWRRVWMENWNAKGLLMVVIRFVILWGWSGLFQWSQITYWHVLVFANVSAGMFFWNQQYVIEFPIILKRTTYRIISCALLNVIRAFRQALLAFIVVLMVALVSFRWMENYYGWYTSFLWYSFMSQYYFVLFHEVFQVYLTIPTEDSINIDTAIDEIQFQDEGTIEYIFMQYREGTQLNNYVASEELHDISRRRFQHVNNMLQKDPKNVLESFRYVRSPFARQLRSSLALWNIWHICRYDVHGSRAAIIRDTERWHLILQRCTAIIDAFSFRLKLFQSVINHNSSTELNRSHVEQYLWQLAGCTFNNIDPVVLEKLMVSSKIEPTRMLNRTQRVQFRLQSIFPHFDTSKDRDAILNSGSQELLWSIEILAMLLVNSKTEDQQGILQHAIPVVLSSFLTCKSAVEELGCLHKHMRPPHTRKANAAASVDYVLETALYSIITAFYNEMKEFSLPSEHAKILKKLANFTM